MRACLPMSSHISPTHYIYGRTWCSDGADDYSAMELTDRLVKWINRQNVFSGMENHPFGIRLAEGNRTGDDSKNVDCGDCFCEDLGVDNDSSGLFWECIPQTQQRAIELCSTIEALEHSDMPIVVSDSNDTLNSVIVRDLRRAAMD